MKNKLDKEYFKYSFYLFIAMALSIVFYFIVVNASYLTGNMAEKYSIIKKVLTPIFIAIFMAYILNPGVRWFENKVFYKMKESKRMKRLSRILSVITVYIVLFGLITMMIIFVVPQIAGSIAEIVRRVPEYINYTVDFLSEWSEEINEANNIYDFTGHIEKNIKGILSTTSKTLEYVLDFTIVGVLNITSVIFNLILGTIISFYLLNDKDSFKLNGEKILRVIFSQEKASKIKDFLRDADTIFGKYVIGKVIDSFIIGVLCFIGLIVLKIKYALLISVIIGITNMIPYFGPFIGAVPAIIITFFDSPMNAVWLAIFILILQQFDGLILGPKILGDSIGLSPFWITFSIVLGGGLYGVIGMFLGVPVVAIAGLLIGRIIDWKLKKKGVKIEDLNNN